MAYRIEATDETFIDSIGNTRHVLRRVYSPVDETVALSREGNGWCINDEEEPELYGLTFSAAAAVVLSIFRTGDRVVAVVNVDEVQLKNL